MSAIVAIGERQNLINRSHKSSNITGPWYRHSFKLLLIFLVFTEALYTTLTLVVVLAGVITLWCGTYIIMNHDILQEQLEHGIIEKVTSKSVEAPNKH